MIFGKSSELEVEFNPRAIKELKEVDRKTRKRIEVAIQGLKIVPPQGDIKKLKGIKGELRLRVGDWRVIFSYDFENRKVLISDILPRREAYR